MGTLFDPETGVFGHLVAVFGEIFGVAVVSGGRLDDTERVVRLEEGDVNLVDGASEVLEGECCLMRYTCDVRVNICEAEVWAPRDAEAVDGAICGGHEIGRYAADGDRVSAVEASHGLEKQGGVFDASCDGPRLSEEIRRWRSGNAGVSGDPSEGWFDGVSAAEV